MPGGAARRVAVPLAIVAIVATAHSVGAHPLHTSLAEIVYDPAAKEIRISIRVFADDLTRASNAYARSHAATRFPEIDYVRSAFVIADRAGHPVALAACGAKPVGDLMWLCFRATGPAAPTGFRVTHKVLFDLYADQINIVQASYGGKKVSLLFTRGDGFKRLD
jgi:hypothetical protein